MNTTKKCKVCNVTKSVDEFPFATPTNRRTRCVECYRGYCLALVKRAEGAAVYVIHTQDGPYIGSTTMTLPARIARHFIKPGPVDRALNDVRIFNVDWYDLDTEEEARELEAAMIAETREAGTKMVNFQIPRVEHRSVSTITAGLELHTGVAVRTATRAVSISEVAVSGATGAQQCA
jgi:predicted GIY-YIG superfamily endonuclease